MKLFAITTATTAALATLILGGGGMAFATQGLPAIYRCQLTGNSLPVGYLVVTAADLAQGGSELQLSDTLAPGLISQESANATISAWTASGGQIYLSATLATHDLSSDINLPANGLTADSKVVASQPNVTLGTPSIHLEYTGDNSTGRTSFDCSLVPSL